MARLEEGEVELTQWKPAGRLTGNARDWAMTEETWWWARVSEVLKKDLMNDARCCQSRRGALRGTRKATRQRST